MCFPFLLWRFVVSVCYINSLLFVKIINGIGNNGYMYIPVNQQLDLFSLPLHLDYLIRVGRNVQVFDFLYNTYALLFCLLFEQKLENWQRSTFLGDSLFLHDLKIKKIHHV